MKKETSPKQPSQDLSIEKGFLNPLVRGGTLWPSFSCGFTSSREKVWENHCQLFHDFFLINLSNSFVNMTIVTRRLLSMRAGALFLYNIHREFLVEFPAEQFSALIPASTSHLLKEKWYTVSLACVLNFHSPFRSHSTCLLYTSPSPRD